MTGTDISISRMLLSCRFSIGCSPNSDEQPIEKRQLNPDGLARYER